ncbi:MAG: 3-hydroxyacyl-CoA dehydrogenase [Candidatus Methanomethylicia archaeon]
MGLKLENLKTVSVIGAGIMGHGIAQVFAMNKYSVNLVDVSHEILNRAIEKIKWSLDKLIERGRISRVDADSTLSRISTYVNVREAVNNADFIIEAIPERLDLKIQTFKDVDEHAPFHAVIASNTSGLPITPMAEATNRPDKVVGMHWFNPPQVMRLIEIVKCKYTSNETAEVAFKLAQKLGKEPILVNKDIRGFIANRVYRTIRYEAFAMIQRGEAKPVEIDSAFRYKLNLPMGPFELVDFTGAIDIEIGENTYFNEMRNKYPEWEPHEEYVKIREYALKLSMEYHGKGWLGVKTGKGFYDYPKPGQWVKVEIPKDAGEKIDPIQVLAPAVNLSAWLVRNNVSTAKEIDTSLKLGYNFPKGLLEIADEYGLDNIVNILRDKRKTVKEDYGIFYEPDQLLLEFISRGKLGKKTGEGFYTW